MKNFKHWLLVLAGAASLLLSADLAAQNQACLKHFAEGKAPVFTRATLDRKSTRLNSSHVSESRMPSSA